MPVKHALQSENFMASPGFAGIRRGDPPRQVERPALRGTCEFLARKSLVHEIVLVGQVPTTPL